MFKKWATLFTILSFVVSSTACLSWSTREIRSEGDYPEPGSKVARVVKTDGEIVDFTGRGLGRRLHERVEGAALVPVEREVELQGPLTSIKKRADGTISEITDAAGRVHDVISVEREGPDRLHPPLRGAPDQVSGRQRHPDRDGRGRGGRGGPGRSRRLRLVAGVKTGLQPA